MTFAIYEPPREGFPCLIVIFREGCDPVARPFWSLPEAKDYIRELSMRALHGEGDAISDL